MSVAVHRSRPAHGLRLAAALAACALAAGLAGVPVAATAADDAGSSLTVSWLNDDSRAAALQPSRAHTSLSQAMGRTGEITNPHYDDFKGLEVTVSQTEGLADQVIQVEVEGMPGGTVARKQLPGSWGYGQTAAFQQNFLQVMQCWGDPAAADFGETCQFGATALAPGDLTATTVSAYRDDALPFRSVQGKDYYPNKSAVPEGAAYYGDLIGPSTTNEQIVVSVREDGTASFGFEVVTSAQAPWLGCGSPDDDLRPCSLVIVPRGTVYGGTKSYPAASGWDPGLAYGEQGLQHGGPTASEVYDYWDNRIVIPLEFAPRSATCAAGSAARLLGGSQLVTAALTSWQRQLCADGGPGFSFASSADERAREQLVYGDVDLAFSSRPVVADELDEVSALALEDTQLVYAPVAASGITIGFNINGQRGLRTELNLTPRLIAKLLTQSYADSLPRKQDSNESHAEHLGVAVPSVFQDPEFTSVNKQLSRQDVNFLSVADVVLVGPSGADGIRLLWEYLQADDKARAFLQGEPDNVLPDDKANKNKGMTINPYYLPAGHAQAVVPKTEEKPNNSGGTTLSYVTLPDGTREMRATGLVDAEGNAVDLTSDVVSTLPQADESLVPWVGDPRTRIDSTAYNPYAETFHGAAQRVFRGDSKRPLWDDQKINGPGLPMGGFTTVQQQLPPSLRMLGMTDTVSAAEYGLTTAKLQLPNQPGVFVAPDASSMAAALSAQAPVEGAETTWTDFSKMGEGAYPLTLVTYAVVNTTTAEPEERQDFAALIDYAATAGQTAGNGVGQLPDGYIPLPEEYRTQARAAATCMTTDDLSAACYPPPEPAVDDDEPGAAAAPPASRNTASGSAATATTVDTAPAPQTAYASGDTVEAAATPAAGSPASGAVGGTLVAALAGAAVAPFLLRRRRSP